MASLALSIGLISSLEPARGGCQCQVDRPSLRQLLTPETVVPQMPAIKVACLNPSCRCGWCWSRQPHQGCSDIDIVASPVVRLPPAKSPTATLTLPVVLLKSAPATDGRVAVAGGVAKERIANRWPCCLSPVVLLRERTNTVGRVVAAGGVASERIKTVGRVVACRCVLPRERFKPLAVLSLPVVLL